MQHTKRELLRHEKQRGPPNNPISAGIYSPAQRKVSPLLGQRQAACEAQEERHGEEASDRVGSWEGKTRVAADGSGGLWGVGGATRLACAVSAGKGSHYKPLSHVAAAVCTLALKKAEQGHTGAWIFLQTAGGLDKTLYCVAL
ncbi:hypothetical protein NDU88_006260 [Pleurodeles waltl]|uniref:Uncharacterized protein n=1 Tax=Pleurodeles waltl TaxID=8319 RepID=A0AAV7LS01_PLEWA|nr:hypothetical protein NDU88_006260 [Pleurodeles waltl]